MSEQTPNQNQSNDNEKLLLTDAEIVALLERLKSESVQDEELEKKMASYNEEQGFHTIDDKFDRDLIEAFSEFFRIDFEKLRGMPIVDGDLLLEGFYAHAPKELRPPQSAEVEMEVDAYLNTPFEKQLERWKEKAEKEKPIDLE